MDAEQRQLLEPYITNLDDQVFAIQNLQGMVGAVMARYSRAQTGLRETLVREFIKEDQLNIRKADKLIDRVLIAYGDDSVGELEGGHVSFEDISMLATKEIEHRRIGGSPIEQSTRYVRFDYRDSTGRFPYVVPTGLAPDQAANYVSRLDKIFEIYGSMWDPLVDYLRRLKPLAEARYDVLGSGEVAICDLSTDRDRRNFEKTYRMDIKTKACDVLRAFLPLATRAHVGLFGNGRFFQHLISKLLSSELSEARQLGQKALVELSKVIPHYVKRAQPLDYLMECRKAIRNLALTLSFEPEARPPLCRSVEPDYDYLLSQLELGQRDSSSLRQATGAEMDLSMTAAMLFPYVRCSFDQIRKKLAECPESMAQAWDAYYGRREVRRNRPERAIEFGYPHNFEMVTEWGVYKDLMRHRMGTIQYQELIPDLGFEMPDEIGQAGLTDLAEKAVQTAESLFADLSEHAAADRSYAFLQGHRMRWMISMNDRALMHMVELRTTAQGHPNYRKACQAIHRSLEDRFPERAKRMKFVNHAASYWSRGDSEARQRVKETQLDEQHP